MADFVDYTNVTELEKFSVKINNLMKELAGDESKNRKRRELLFRGVEFEISLVEAEEDPVLKGIPHFRFNENQLQKCFDIGRYWLLECVEKGRVLSESTGRLLLGSLIQSNSSMGLAAFVRIGEVNVSEKYVGFHKYLGSSEYFETFPESGKSKSESSEKAENESSISSAQIILQWLPDNLRVNYPGFTGHFDSWHPIEQIQIRCIWPKISAKSEMMAGKFKRQDLLTAPIWLVSFEEAEEQLPLRNTMLRSIQAAHLRELLFTPMGKTALISIAVSKEGKFPPITSLRSLFDAMAQIYRKETERLESDVTIRYSFIPKRVMETMRWERMNEAFSLLWRRFIRNVEESWNCLVEIDIKPSDEEDGEVEKSLNFINWCIQRELEWEAALKEHAMLRKLYRIPKRHLYNTAKLDDLTVDEKIDDISRKLESNFKELGRTISNSESGDENNISDDVEEEEEEEEVFEDCFNHDVLQNRKVLELEFDLNGHVIYEPITLNCEPPPGKLLTKSLLKNPLAGDVIALNQLREDIRSFKAWNPEICGVECYLDSGSGLIHFDSPVNTLKFDLGFVGFLLWHSPNDIEAENCDGGGGRIKVSVRMRDLQGQWLEMWKESSAEAETESKLLCQQVSFNHRGLLGQVVNDLMLKTDLSQILESATPFLTRRAAQLLSSEAGEIVERIEAENRALKSAYPLDAINSALNDFEKEMTRNQTLTALCSNIFAASKQVSGEAVLVSDDKQREFLLNSQHQFKTISREMIGGSGGGWEYRESISGYEGIRIKLPY